MCNKTMFGQVGMYLDKIRRENHKAQLRKRLKVSSFSIISNSCVGGVMLHDLGQEFLTPTVNISMLLEDYWFYVIHLREFQNAELSPLREIGKQHAVGHLNRPGVGTVKINFWHYDDIETARDKWIERSKRINFDNIYLVVTADTEYERGNREIIEKIDALPYPKMIISKNRHDGIRNEYPLEICDPACQPLTVLDYKKGKGYRYLDDIDYVSFLNKNAPNRL